MTLESVSCQKLLVHHSKECNCSLCCSHQILDPKGHQLSWWNCLTNFHRWLHFQMCLLIHLHCLLKELIITDKDILIVIWTTYYNSILWTFVINEFTEWFNKISIIYIGFWQNIWRFWNSITNSMHHIHF